ncbi:hypothetical protein AYI69_g318, partial [Smittium culicis]
MQESLQISKNILSDLNSSKLSSIPSQLSQLESLIFTPVSDDQVLLQVCSLLKKLERMVVLKDQETRSIKFISLIKISNAQIPLLFSQDYSINSEILNEILTIFANSLFLDGTTSVLFAQNEGASLLADILN